MKTKPTNEDALIKECRKNIAAKRPARLWPFTDEEEKWMHKAKINAIRFMARFGQAPQQPQIDLSHYANIRKYNWYGRN